MRFHQLGGLVPQSNVNINANLIASEIINSNNFANVTENFNLREIKANNLDSLNNKTTTLVDILKLNPDSRYFKNYFDSQQTDTSNVDLRNGNNGDVFIESLNFVGDNLTEFVASSPPTTPYDNRVTNQSFNEQTCLSVIQRQRRENLLIKLDLESNYMTRHEGPMQVGDNSAGCSVESSPVDSLLDDQELLSPALSSFADLSSPDLQQQQHRRYPRGIINPNYPGFQHLAHTLAEHFIDHHFEHSSDSEISEDFDFDVAYRSENLDSINMNDSNNNNDSINNNGDGPEKNIDLNRNKNRRSSHAAPVNDLSVTRDGPTAAKTFEDGNVNLMMKSDTKVFCESKQLGLRETEESEEEDEEHCIRHNSFKTETDSSRMEFDDDELADLSGEDDAAIKNELENIDKADNEYHENGNPFSIECDLATYLQQYDFKMDLKKTYKRSDDDEECLTDEDNSKLPTPDILIEHNRDKLQNDELVEKESVDNTGGCAEATQQRTVDVSHSDETRDYYQPDLIKNIADTINTNDNNEGGDGVVESGEGDNEILNENPGNANKADANDEKIINQVQMEMNTAVTITRNLPLSLESASSVVDIIGDFGKEIEKEIGLIVSGYRNEGSSGRRGMQPIRPVVVRAQPKSEVFDENKFIEHLKCFSKMGDASLSNAEETIIVKHALADASDRHESNISQCFDSADYESFIPTAIVKPKYQKLAFDDRQLPICGSGEDKPWTSPTNTLSMTITTTPRKVQKHLPKSQKSFAKSTRKFANKSGEFCADFDVSDKKFRNSEKEIDCGVTQNSIAIVQPLKKVIDASANMNDEKNPKPIDSSKNSHPKYVRNSGKAVCKVAVANELAPRMSECGNNNLNVATRKAASVVRESEKKVPTRRADQKEISDAFDVYNIETALPVIDLDAIELHLMAAKEEEQKRKNDREAIRRRLAMGEEDDYLSASRPVRKPNLQSRLQNGHNLQICFMNEAASDSESSDSETCPKLSQGMSRKKNVQRSSSLMNHRNASLSNNPYNSRPLSVVKSVMDPVVKAERPATLALGPPSDPSDNNFFTQQARLQIEARMALAQAKDMAHMQMEIERQKQGMCPITKLVHSTLNKVGMTIPPTKRRLSRQLLTNMNIAQLQIIINEFHTFIETLNEVLVKYLMDRDDLSMRQDSMLIDIEDITRYLAEKEEVQLSAAAKPLQKHRIETKPAFNKRVQVAVPTASKLQPKAFAPLQQPARAFVPMQQNKKSLVVNGNGHSVVRTSISRETIEQNGLHL